MNNQTEAADEPRETVEQTDDDSPSPGEETAQDERQALSATDAVDARVEARLRLWEAQQACQDAQEAVSAYHRDLAGATFQDEDVGQETLTEVVAVLTRLLEANLHLEGRQ